MTRGCCRWRTSSGVSGWHCCWCCTHVSCIRHLHRHSTDIGHYHHSQGLLFRWGRLVVFAGVHVWNGEVFIISKERFNLGSICFVVSDKEFCESFLFPLLSRTSSTLSTKVLCFNFDIETGNRSTKLSLTTLAWLPSYALMSIVIFLLDILW